MPQQRSTIGLARTTVAVRDYCEDWPRLYGDEAIRLERLFGDDMVAMEHIGSTAIPGMLAKPIIDIMVAVPDLEAATIYQSRLAEMDYERRTNGDLEDRRFFAKGPRNCRTHHLSLTLMHSTYWTEHIAFRETLIQQPDLAIEYSQLKQELARLYPNDRGSYTAAKAAFIAKVLKIAE